MDKLSYKIIGSCRPTPNELQALMYFRDNLYDKAFFGDEKEDFKQILDRIGQGNKNIRTYVCLAYVGEKVVGGVIADWFSPCASLLMSYLVVAEDCRSNGIGARILKDGMKTLCSEIGETVEYVFFESENPFCGNDDQAVSRLRFYARNGAKRIPIQYVQPPLSNGQDFARNLDLYCLPALSEGRDPLTEIPADKLKEYLKVFYDALAGRITDEEKIRQRKDELSRMEQTVDDLASDERKMVFLENIFENPNYKIDTCTVARHFLFDTIAKEGGKKVKVPFDKKESSEECADPCPVFYSYETDLMDYRHQGGKIPFRTHFYKLFKGVKLLLPKAYRYESEGLSVLRILERKDLDVDISLSWSKSLYGEPKYLIHLSISPCRKDRLSGKDQDAFFTELDLIRFTTAFGCNQERYQCISAGDVLVKGDGDSWGGFSILEEGRLKGVMEWIAEKMAGISIESLTALGCGITELNLYGLYKKEGGTRVFDDFDAFHSQMHEKELWNKTFCGIILGIYDYERMTTAEIYDTMRSNVERPQSFMVFLRGHLLKIKCVLPSNDNERLENILISPYLLIPSCALVYNELLLDDCNSRVKQLLNEEKDDGQKKFWNIFSDRKYYERSRQLLTEYNKWKRSLEDNYLQSFFQYEGEKEIMSKLSLQRGYTDRLQLLFEKLEAIRGYSDKHMQDYNSGAEMNLNMILLVLAILQVVTAVIATAMAGISWSWVLMVLVSALLFIFFLALGRFLLKNRREK